MKQIYIIRGTTTVCAPSEATAKCFLGEDRKLPTVQAELYFITEIRLEDGLSHRKQGNWSPEKLKSLRVDDKQFQSKERLV